MIVFKIREIEESFFSQNYEVICEKKRFRTRMFGLCTEYAVQKVHGNHFEKPVMAGTVYSRLYETVA